ncbi:MAG: chemotaxis protein CheW [Hydrococcus sp. SU_1_0]|nr:chemotaxis protein CheW [Hydrococcus sp. SU_1_0]
MQTGSPNTLQYLKFQLHPDTKAMLPIQQITEVLKIQLGQIMPIPQMPSWVMGVYNWRGDILWMVDLGQLMGLASWYQQERLLHTAIVLSPEGATGNSEQKIHLGLMGAVIDDLATCDPEVIQEIVDSSLNPPCYRFASGYWLKTSGEMILALDGQAIASAMPRSPN